jgi:hypothetical protein
MRARLALLFALAVLGLALVPSRSRAELWCADPMWAHEWGVVVFQAGAGSRSAGPRLPAHFHGPSGTGTASTMGPPVRELPVDGGERALPVLAFYTTGAWEPGPVGIEVGFRDGEATRWFPEVDARRTLAEVTSPAAIAERARLVATRRSRTQGSLPPTGRDPTRQLVWDRLELDRQARHPVAPTTEGWVRALRDEPSALWVNRTSATGGESERFVFYEARTREAPAITIERGPTHAAGRRHLVLRNTSSHPVHDVLLVHREGAQVFVLSVPTIGARASAGYVLEEHAVPAAALPDATRGQLRAALVDPQRTAAPTGHAWGGPHGCVMQRDPAVPFDHTTDHRLYAAEVDRVLDAWGPRFFDATGTTLVYREDVAQLDEVMPLAVHTDMYHHVELRRLGLALVENVTLP